MDLAEDVYEGEAVFADYSDRIHCPTQFRTESIPVLRNCEYIGGWDCGATLQPAFVLLQITRIGQIHALLEVLPPAPESMESFAPRVMSAIVQRLPANWDEVQHVADATVIQRSGVDGRTARQEAARHGFDLKPVSNVWAPRFAAVTWLLADRIDDDTPRFVISGPDCPTLRAGFKGRYKFAEAGSDSVGAARVFKMPVKDGYSHPQDGLQYAAIKARSLVVQRSDLRHGLRR